MHVPQNDLKAGYLAHKDEIDAAMTCVAESGWYILGKEVEAFEREFADYCGAQHGIGVANGTDAIVLALKTLGIGPGDKVATVSHTAVATVAAIRLAGALPVLVDIDPLTYTMSPQALEMALHVHPDIRAIIPVHLYGHPAPMLDIMNVRFTSRRDVVVIEDCSQAHGALIAGIPVGSFGDIATYSLYPTKNLGALGDGGVITTCYDRLAKRARMLRQYGWEERYVSKLEGMNTRLDELQAAILRVKLKYLDEEVDRRREIAQLYNEGLHDLPLMIPSEIGEVTHAYHQYVIRHTRRDELQQRLKELGVGTLVHYPAPVHLQPAYYGDDKALIIGSLSETETACKQVLSLPMYPQMTDNQVDFVIDAVRQAVKEI